MRILHSEKIILISKPRSGSTSLRAALNTYLESDDIACDTPFGCWHPHHTAARLKTIFNELGWCYDDYWKICTCRNPFELLISYFQYFRPDLYGNYNYQSVYDSSNLMSFKVWLQRGKIWDQTKRELGSDWGTIGVEAFCFDEEGNCLVDEIVDLSLDADTLKKKLSKKLSDPFFEIPHLNRSASTEDRLASHFDSQSIDRIQELFKKEFELFPYNSPPR